MARDTSIPVDNREVICSFRRLPHWFLSRVYYSKHRNKTDIPTREMVVVGKFFEDDGEIHSADDIAKRYYTDPIKRWVRAEYVAEDFGRAFSPHFDLSSGEYHAWLAETWNPTPDYIRDPRFHFTKKEIEELYKANPVWAEMETKVYGSLYRPE